MEDKRHSLTEKISTRPIKYKGWQIKYCKIERLYEIFTPAELENPIGFREAEAQLYSIEQAKTFIDHYNDY